MDELILGILVVLFGSFLWVGIQTAAWYFGLGRVFNYAQARSLLFICSVGAPVLVFFVLGISMLIEDRSATLELVILPACVAGIFMLSWLGLRLAYHLRRPSDGKPRVE